MLALLHEAQPWRERAACVDDIDLMYDQAREETAKALCRRCLVQMDCLGYAIDSGEPDGIWGGASLADRQRMRAELRAAKAVYVTAVTGDTEPSASGSSR